MGFEGLQPGDEATLVSQGREAVPKYRSCK